ncbi:RHA1A [Hepatospora eriocheir]|uniref:RHA1A n=1 Tax=Hepatospora eriocheir TaxID=1081669 RepID=A0A1X0QK05_9MICR|nr:RHA1A [Hepatospora eriocheir]
MRDFILGLFCDLEYAFRCNKEILVYNDTKKTILRLYGIYSDNVEDVGKSLRIFIDKSISTPTNKNALNLIVYSDVIQKNNVLQDKTNFIYDKSILSSLCDIKKLEAFIQYGSVNLINDYNRKLDTDILKIHIYDYNLIYDIFGFVMGIFLVICAYHVGKYVLGVLTKLEPDYNRYKLEGSLCVTKDCLPDNVTECLICYASFEDSDDKIRKLPCSHYFHAECVDRWIISRNRVCPLCRTIVPVIDTYA